MACFICRELMGAFRNELTDVTGYSEKTLFQLFGKNFLQKENENNYLLLLIITYYVSEDFTSIRLTDEIVQEAGVCQNCFIKFNEYDEYRMMAENVRSQIIALLDDSNEEAANDPEDSVSFIKQELDISDRSMDSYEECSPLEVDDESQMIVYDFSTEKARAVSPQASIRTSRWLENKPDDSITGNQIMYQCEICFKTLKDKSKLKSHREIHTTERNVICPVS